MADNLEEILRCRLERQVNLERSFAAAYERKIILERFFAVAQKDRYTWRDPSLSLRMTGIYP